MEFYGVPAAVCVDYVIVDLQLIEKLENAIFFKIFKISSNGQLVYTLYGFIRNDK